MKSIVLNPEQWKALRFAFKVINGETPINPQEKSDAEILSFVDSIFKDAAFFKKAWETCGFPFEKINSIFEDLTGEEHPVFVKIFGGSFISSMAKNNKENPGECGKYSPEDISAYCLRGAAVSEYLKAQGILV